MTFGTLKSIWKLTGTMPITKFSLKSLMSAVLLSETTLFSCTIGTFVSPISRSNASSGLLSIGMLSVT